MIIEITKPTKPAAAAPAGLAVALKRRRLAGLAFAVLAGLLSIWAAAGWSRAPKAAMAEPPGITVEKDAIAVAQGAPQWQVLKLGVAGPANTHWTDPVPARVVIDETRASKVGVPLSGRVTSVFVELGQTVRERAPLFSVASPEIAELRAQKEKAAVDLDAAKAALDRVRALVATRALPAKEELAAQRDLKEADLSYKLAGSKLESLRVSSQAENEFTVIAPRSGVVVEKNVLPGQALSPDGSGTLMVVADLSSVWVVADLFEAQATQVKEGSPAQISSPSRPDLQLEGKVEMVSSVVDPNRHTVPIRVRLRNPEGALRPNVFARVRFGAAHNSGTVEVPASALVTDGEHQYVYVQADEGRFSRREVVAGSSHDGMVPVLSGLRGGETVVEEGAILLDNQMVLSG